MKNIALSILAFAALSAGVLASQDLSGAWQGTLSINGREARVVIKISNEAGGPKAVLYNIDQGTGAIPGGAVTVHIQVNNTSAAVSDATAHLTLPAGPFFRLETGMIRLSVAGQVLKGVFSIEKARTAGADHVAVQLITERDPASDYRALAGALIPGS